MNKWIRQFHRWMSMAFILGVVTYSILMTRGQPPAWAGLMAAVPLIALLLTGLYLVALPYVLKWRGAPRGGVQA
jgi:hypothetical protein